MADETTGAHADISSRRVVRAILKDQLFDGEVTDSESCMKGLVLHAREVAMKTRSLAVYQELFRNLETDEIYFTPTTLDTMVDNIFRYSQSASERVSRACVFLTFVVDVCKKTSDPDIQESIIESSTQMTACRVNDEDWVKATERGDSTVKMTFIKLFNTMVLISVLIVFTCKLVHLIKK